MNISKTAILFVSMALPFTSAAASHKGEWLFLANDGDYIGLSQPDAEIQIAEELYDAQFCQKASGMALCISSKVFDLAIPSKIKKEWHSGSRVYCVTRRFSLDAGDDPRGDYYQILSALGENCSTTREYDESFIYSSKLGLRAASINKPDFKIGFTSINKLGFGAGLAR